MKIFLPFLLLLILSFSLSAQIRTDTVRNGEQSILMHYSDYGLSCKHAIPEYGGPHGIIAVFDSAGNEVLSRQLYAFGGGVGVSYKFHPNGSVKFFRLSYQPDGGIQWHRDKWYFDETGKVIKHEEEGWDDHTRIFAP